MQPDRIRKAVLEILEAIGEDPARPELAQTPQKVADAYESFFSGIGKDPLSALSETFVAESPEAVLLKDIELVSICEHHLLPFTGVAHIAYLPDRRVVGISKLARVLDSFARRLQTQETMTAQISQTIQNALAPKGVAILIDAQHQCMTTRGVKKADVSMITTSFTGVFKTDDALRNRFFSQIQMPR